MKTAITKSFRETDIVMAFSAKEFQSKRSREVVVLRIPEDNTEPGACETCPSTPPSFSAPTSILPNDGSLDSSSSGPASVQDDTEDLLACGLLADELSELELLEAKYSSTASHAPT